MAEALANLIIGIRQSGQLIGKHGYDTVNRCTINLKAGPSDISVILQQLTKSNIHFELVDLKKSIFKIINVVGDFRHMEKGTTNLTNLLCMRLYTKQHVKNECVKMPRFYTMSACLTPSFPAALIKIIKLSARCQPHSRLGVPIHLQTMGWPQKPNQYSASAQFNTILILNK